jgi:hypothetical protein
MRRISIPAALTFLSLAMPIRAADQPPEAAAPVPPAEETLGQPNPLQPNPVPVPMGYFRVSRYAVWQYYGVDRHGGFRPLVVDTPDGAYYRANGRPFPWVPTHMREFEQTIVGDFMPYVVD